MFHGSMKPEEANQQITVFLASLQKLDPATPVRTDVFANAVNLLRAMHVHTQQKLDAIQRLLESR